MPRVHRNGDKRYCGGLTVVTGQTKVYVNGELVAVEGDMSSHEEGALIAGVGSTYINNKKVIVKGDTANIDDIFHLPAWPYPAEFSPGVYMNGANEPEDPDLDEFPPFAEAAAAAQEYWEAIDPELAATINAADEVATALNEWYIPFPTTFPNGDPIVFPPPSGTQVTESGSPVTFNGVSVTF